MGAPDRPVAPSPDCADPRPAEAPAAERGRRPSGWVRAGAVESEQLVAPLYVAWQITNECNLACLHCIEESGPGKAFKDELDKKAAFSILRQLAEAQVPYVSFSGGEPMLHPDFFEMAGYLASRGVNLKIETNGHCITKNSAERLRSLDVRAVQVSLDGATQGAFNKMRTLGRFEKALEGMNHLREAGVPLEVNFAPARFNIHEAGNVIDIAHSYGAFSFYTGRLMRTGNAARTWHLLEPTEEQYAEFFETLRRKAKDYEGRMRVTFHEMGITEELKVRLVHPAALFIILPNGKVKLINALPFLIGDLSRQPLALVWKNFQRAWKHPQVARFVRDLEADPGLVSRLHQWVELDTDGRPPPRESN